MIGVIVSAFAGCALALVVVARVLFVAWFLALFIALVMSLRQ